MKESDWTKSFYTATHLLPDRLWRGIFTLSSDMRMRCEEIRLRAGRPFIAVCDGIQSQISNTTGELLIVEKAEIEETLMRLTKSSIHTYLPQLIEGFFTTEQGHRIGVCGEIVTQNGHISSMRNISSLNIRIAKECRGIGEGLLPFRKSGESVLVISPPGGGKTTLLRDLARINSQKYRVAILDQRYELAACMHGIPRYQIGQCDVLSGGNKKDGIEILLRCMNPEIIVLDEITNPDDCDALLSAWGCGCDFFASAHGNTIDELYQRPIYRKLLTAGIFKYIITISNTGGNRTYQTQKGDTHAKTPGGDHDRWIMHTDRSIYQSTTT